MESAFFVYIICILISLFGGSFIQRGCPDGGFKFLGYMAFIPCLNISSAVIVVIVLTGELIITIVNSLFGEDKKNDK